MRDLVDELLRAKVKAQLFGGDHAPRLGRLVLLERIGSGAMGDVFSAHDPRLDRKVAVKLVRPTAAVPAERVLAEARALAKLAHPNVVAIYDAESLDAFGGGNASDSDGAIAIVMELAPGIPLRAWLTADRDWRDIARVLREAAIGLAAAHAAGLVHRDIKPDNILVGDDRTRVVDFGLALAGDAEDEAVSGAGTPTYMAPEVLGGAPATPAADQFSFGVTMFEALYGVRPHTGTSREELRTAALRAASAKPPPSSRATAPTVDATSLAETAFADTSSSPDEAAKRVAPGSSHLDDTAPSDTALDETAPSDTAFDKTALNNNTPRSQTRPNKVLTAVRTSTDGSATDGSSTGESSATAGSDPIEPSADGAPVLTPVRTLFGRLPDRGGTSSQGERDGTPGTKRGSAGVRRGSAPAWLHAIAVRALAGDPHDRFASMADLAAALGRDRRHRRVIALAIGAAIVAAGVTGVVAYRARDTIDPCAGAAVRIGGVWSAERATAVKAQLGDGAWVPATLARLGAESERWATSYRAVCEATRVRGEQSDSLLDLRMRCLDRALDRFDSLATALAGTLDPSARTEATSAIGELPAPEACETLVDAGELALPTEPAARGRALAARHAVARAWAVFSLSKYRDAQKIAADTEIAIPGLDAPGVAAELAVVRAAIEARIGTAATAKPALDRALLATSTVGAAELELSVWAMRMRQELFAGDPARVEEILPLARAAAARAHREGAELDGIAGEALRDAGRLVEAREHLERALASKDPLRGDQRAVITMNLGAVHLAAMQLDLAETAFTRAHDLARDALGEGHPSLALYLDKLAALDRVRGRLSQALARNEQSLALRMAAYGGDDRSVATSLLGRARTRLAMAATDHDQLVAATADANRAREIRTKVFGATSPRLGEVEAVLGDIATAAGTPDVATVHYQRARELDVRRAD